MKKQNLRKERDRNGEKDIEVKWPWQREERPTKGDTKTGIFDPPPQRLAASEGASGRPEGGVSAVGPAGAAEAAHTLPRPG